MRNHVCINGKQRAIIQWNKVPDGKYGTCIFRLKEKKACISKDIQPNEYTEDYFEDCGDVVIDHDRNLMWQQSGSEEPIVREVAQSYVSDMNCKQFSGYRDWRLPTLEELASLRVVPDLSVHPFFDEEKRFCWCTNPCTSSRGVIRFNFSLVKWYYLYGGCYIRLVRSC